MKTKLHDWNIADYLKTPEERAAYIEAAMDENDPSFFAQALADVASATGKRDLAIAMSGIAAYMSAVALTPAVRPQKRASANANTGRVRSRRRELEAV